MLASPFHLIEATRIITLELKSGESVGINKFFNGSIIEHHLQKLVQHLVVQMPTVKDDNILLEGHLVALETYNLSG